MASLGTYLSFVRISHTVFALPFALTGALLAALGAAARLGGARLDPGLHGLGAQRRDGLQPAGRRAVRRRQSRAPPAASCRAAR